MWFSESFAPNVAEIWICDGFSRNWTRDGFASHLLLAVAEIRHLPNGLFIGKRSDLGGHWTYLKYAGY